MVTKAATVYPSISAYSSSAQLNLGPYNIPLANRLLRVEVRGQVNFSAFATSGSVVMANSLLWAVQWVPGGAGASDIVTTADGPQFPVREQLGTSDELAAYTVSTSSSYVLYSYGLRANWAGQIVPGASIDLFLSTKPPTGLVPGTYNVFASLRFWWT